LVFTPQSEDRSEAAQIKEENVGFSVIDFDEVSIYQKLKKLNTNKSEGPDGYRQAKIIVCFYAFLIIQKFIFQVKSGLRRHLIEFYNASFYFFFFF